MRALAVSHLNDCSKLEIAWLVGYRAIVSEQVVFQVVCPFEVLRVRFDSQHQAADNAAVRLDDDG